MKKRNKHSDKVAEVFGDKTEDVHDNSYKYVCYSNLIFKALRTFVLGLLTSYLFKHM